ncbi:MAG: hypothetical protein SPJ08_02605 [Sphaerochaetaceae bacterium]|nr:hypothetical protein [Sphaerochaetaceae bacterium]
MSDLISRSIYKSKLLKALDVLNKEYREAMLNEDDDLILAIKNQQSAFMLALTLLDNEPTAYSVEKVIKELEEKASRYTKKYVTPYGNNGYRDVKAISIHKAIEIVKQGGVGTETETIRDKAVKWNNNSSKRVPYEFIDYVEGKREICVSDDVCECRLFKGHKFLHKTSCGDVFDMQNGFKYCPYCGKNIKVVE